MATETLRRRSPLGSLAGELAASCATPLFSCREDPFRTLTEIRCASGSEAEVASAVGGALPPLNSWAAVGDSLVVSLGPRWWMVDAPDGESPVTGGPRVFAVDVSAQRTPLTMSGTAVRDVLAHGCSLDLHPGHFAVGAAAQSLLAKAGVIVARTGDDEFRVWVRASFARYLATWIMDASVEYR